MAEKNERDSKRRRRKRRGLGSPAEVEALLAEDEAASVVDPEALAGDSSSESASEPAQVGRNDPPTTGDRD